MVPASRPWPPPETGAPVRPSKNRVPRLSSTTTVFHEKDRIPWFFHAVSSRNPGSHLGIAFAGSILAAERCNTSLRTRSPVGEEGEKVGGADNAVDIQIG